MILAAAVMMAAACTVDTDTPEDASDPPACDAELVEALGKWTDAGFSGSVAITSDGEFTCRAGFGLADVANGTPNSADTVFGIGSVSKAFTAAAVLDLVDAGVLALDDRAGELLPGLGGAAAEVTVEQLLLHTGGLAGEHGGDHEPLGREEAVEAIGALGSEFEPGSDFLYSNSGYSLLALIIDETSGTSYREYMAEEILIVPGRGIGGFWDGEPAAPGPRAVGYEDGQATSADGSFEGPHWALEGNGDLAMTAPELAEWTAALFGDEVVSDRAVELLTTTAFDYGDGNTEVPGWVRLDEQVLGAPVYATAGGGGDLGHDAVTAWLPETRQSIAIATNTSDLTAEELLQAIGPALAAGDPIPVPESQAVEVDPAELEQRAGTYALDSGGTLTVEAAEDSLVIAADGADAVEAMFEPPGGVTAEDIERHEAAVVKLLNGETDAGREEHEILESDLGTIEDVELAGSVVENGELRTYVRITADGEATLGWYALDDHGTVAGVSLGEDPPSFELVPAGEGEYRQENLNGAGLGIRVTFEEDLMTVTGSDGAVEARRTT